MSDLTFEKLSISPTEEQKYILENCSLGKSSVNIINAYAGTGKTTTLRLITEYHPNKNFLYLCFNKALSEEAKKVFPENVEVRTVHSLAYSKLPTKYKSKLGNLRPRELQDLYKLKDAYIASAVLNTLDSYFNSGDREIQRNHIGPIPAGKTAAEIISLAEKVHNEMLNHENKSIPMSHNCYLKMWHLNGSKLKYDAILLDEAQDTNLITEAIVFENLKNYAVILVGDIHQSIYGWRGAVNSMERIASEHEHRHFKLTVSFRFPQSIANIASYILNSMKNDDVTITSAANEDERGSKVSTQCILGRTNAELLETAYDLAISGKKLHFLGTDKSKSYSPEILYKFNEIKDIYYLSVGEMNKIKTSYIRRFNSYSELLKYVKGDSEGIYSDLELTKSAALVKKQKGNIFTFLKKITLSCTSAENANATFSTVHKAKGKEWDRVYLLNDYYDLNNDQELLESKAIFPAHRNEEINLIYVALTRAKKELVLDKYMQKWFNSQIGSDAVKAISPKSTKGVISII